MRDHELELIAALVEGRLDDESGARALIASSSEARAEYEMQKLAYESLRDIGTARLSESERAALHRDLWTELRAETPAATAGSPWYYRWVPVAAGLFVIIGLTAVLSGGAQDAATTFGDIASGLGGADAAADTTTTAAGETSEEDAGDDAAALAPETTEAMTESDTHGAADGEVALYEAEAEKVRRGDYDETLRLYEAQDTRAEACIERSDLENYRPVATLDRTNETVGDEEILVAAPELTALADAPLAFIALDSCELVYLDESPG